MDQRRGDIGQDVTDILHTRTAISEKLELLEQRIQETVQGARTSVEEVVDHVKDTADDLLNRTKESFDPSYQVNHHPWLMIGGAVAVGYVLGLLEARAASQARGAAYAYPPERSPGLPDAPLPRQANVWESVARELSTEIEHAKEGMIEAGRSFIQEFFQQLIPAVIDTIARRRESATAYHGHRGNGSDMATRH